MSGYLNSHAAQQFVFQAGMKLRIKLPYYLHFVRESTSDRQNPLGHFIEVSVC